MMQSALAFGLQWDALAAIAVATLERWEAQQPAVLRQLADQLVPLLEPYLQEASEQELQPAPLTALGALRKLPCPRRMHHHAYGPPRCMRVCDKLAGCIRPSNGASADRHAAARAQLWRPNQEPLPLLHIHVHRRSGGR